MMEDSTLHTMQEEITLHTLDDVFGDGGETVVIVPVHYPCDQFQLQVGTGWSHESRDNNAILRKHLSTIKTLIKKRFNMRELVGKHYDLPSRKEEPNWDPFDMGCRWYAPPRSRVAPIENERN